MTARKMFCGRISLAPYGGRCWLIAGATREELSAWMHRRFGVATQGDSDGEMIPIWKAGQPDTYIVYVRDWSWLISEQAMAVHELFHLAKSVLKDAKVRDEEAFAYYLQHLVSEAWSALWKARQ